MVHDNDASASVITQASTTIEPDEGFDDQNYDNERLENASTSLTSTMRDYEFENGRRYHKFQEGRYAFPNDDEEQERENMKHAMILNLSGGRLHFAPIGKNPQNIIDVGTGTGVWCMDSMYFKYADL
jgi:inner membrane protein involved in colicin E2 resistance